MDNSITKKRLALIKHLYNIGIGQSESNDYSASFSILPFHDSVEMFLKLISEIKDVNTNKLSFIQFWDKIPRLTMKESMRNLNTRRVNLKHKGILPSKMDIEISKVTTIDFFQENCITQLGIDWSNVSRSYTIVDDTLRELIEEAESYLNASDFKNTIIKLTIAFHLSIKLYENTKLDIYGFSPFDFDKNLNNLHAFNGITQKRNIASLASKTRRNLEVIHSTLKIISLGIDYKKYLKFKLLTPIVTFIEGEKEPVLELIGKPIWNQQNCNFCINFVIEAIHVLQEFDYEIEQLIKETTMTIEDVK